MPDTKPTVTDWRCGGFGNYGIVVIERMSDGTYRIGQVLAADAVQDFLRSNDRSWV